MTVARPKSLSLDILTAVALAAAFVLTAAVYARLPNPMPTHFDLHGRPNGWMPRAAGAWFGPIVMGGVVGLLRFGARIVPPGWRDRLDASPVRFVSFALALTALGVQSLVLRASLSPMPRLDGAVWVLLGALFVAMGLALPRIRRNPFFGVRTAFALSSDENWARTQRVGGYAMTIGGVVAMTAGFLGAASVAMGAIAVSAFGPAICSWVVARTGPGDIPPSSSDK
ncbi:MAG: DUF1648 domain-containing protein [Polyangiaceae bacterium]|jgi:uncharacterized membrane protein